MTAKTTKQLIESIAFGSRHLTAFIGDVLLGVVLFVVAFLVGLVFSSISSLRPALENVSQSLASLSNAAQSGGIYSLAQSLVIKGYLLGAALIATLLVGFFVYALARIWLWAKLFDKKLKLKQYAVKSLQLGIAVLLYAAGFFLLSFLFVRIFTPIAFGFAEIILLLFVLYSIDVMGMSLISNGFFKTLIEPCRVFKNFLLPLLIGVIVLIVSIVILALISSFLFSSKVFFVQLVNAILLLAFLFLYFSWQKVYASIIYQDIKKPKKR